MDWLRLIWPAADSFPRRHRPRKTTNSMPLPAIIRHNLGLKTVAFVLATLLWLTIHYEIGVTSSSGEVMREFRNVRIRVLTDVNDSRDYQVVPPEVSLTVSGDPATIRQFREKDFQVFVNMSGSTDLLNGYIRRVEVVRPMGVNRLKVDPPLVQVEILKKSAPETDLNQ